MIAGLFVHPDAETFFRDFWERRFCPLDVADPALVKGLFTREDALRAVRYSPATVRVVYRGHALCPEEYRDGDGHPDAGRLEDLLLGGASFNVDEVHRYSSRLLWYARTLERAMGFRVGVNFYHTPPDSRALAPHYDSHDIFVTQVEGEKEWRICGRLTAPVPLRALHTHHCSGEDFEHEFTLKAGEVFYLPRGLGHEASCGGASSSHLTVGFHPLTLHGLLHDLLRREARVHPELGRSLPKAWLEGRDFAAMERRMEDLLDSLGDDVEALRGRPPGQGLEHLRWLPRDAEGPFVAVEGLAWQQVGEHLEVERPTGMALPLKLRCQPWLEALRRGEPVEDADFLRYLFDNGLAIQSAASAASPRSPSRQAAPASAREN